MQRNHHHHQTAQPSYHRLRCIVLGSANAGKTCLLRRYVHDRFEDDIEVNRSATKRVARSTNSTLGADYYVKKINNRSVMLQLWDTAGKERLKPQKIPNEYDKKSNYYQFLSISAKSSPKNTNNYEHRYNNWNQAIVHGKEEIQAQIQNLHTNSQRDKNNEQPTHRQTRRTEANKPMGDALFRNMDACMLVYDATSSTSFLHLMQWHSEWIQKLKQWEKEELEPHEKRKRRRRRVPFIVVANKIDLLKEDKKNVSPRVEQGEHSNHRSVMGFDQYAGKSCAYEYAVEDYSTDESEREHQPQDRLLRSGHKQLTYSLKETTWSNDPTYIKSLQLTEDQLPANRLMILLWCQRNGIPHVEASALSGEGVDEAMDMLVKMGVEEFEARENDIREREKHEQLIREEQQRQNTANELKMYDASRNGVDNNIVSTVENNSQIQNGQQYFIYQPSYERDLDLFARYSSDDEKKCSFFSCFWSFFSSCVNR
ncbi:hypothetical protein ACHAWC_006707 [Mediolabrus comicus]